MYHISDLKKYSVCPKLYQLSKENEGCFFNYFKNDYDMTFIYKSIFGIKDYYLGRIGDSKDRILNEIHNYDYYINARFEKNDIRVKVPLLIKNNNEFNLYFFKPVFSKDLDIDSLYIVYDVLKFNNIFVNDIYIITINRDYVFRNEINFNDALIIFNVFNYEKIIDLVLKHNYDYEKIIDGLNNSFISSFYDDKLTNECGSCEYFHQCKKDVVDNDSVLSLVSSKSKYDMYADNILHLKDIDISRIDGTSLQFAQIMASRNNGFFIDKFKLKSFLNDLDIRPLSFIDFEWDTYLFPSYDGMKCLSTLPFEFSLFYYDEDNNLYDYTYVGKDDCREEFIIKLIEKLPKNGKIVAYNSFSAEVLRLKELAIAFPKYKKELESIINRFVDIAEVFSKGYLYDLRFCGQLSLKKISSIVSYDRYNNLNIKNGLQAVYYYRQYLLTNDDNYKEYLVDYCKTDAYCLIVIYKYLTELL